MEVNLHGNKWQKPQWRFWSACDRKDPINYLELLAAKHSIIDCQEIWQGCKHIRIRSDNTTAIGHINNMGDNLKFRKGNMD